MAESQTAAPSRVAAAGQDVLLATKLHVPRLEFSRTKVSRFHVTPVTWTSSGSRN